MSVPLKSKILAIIALAAFGGTVVLFFLNNENNTGDVGSQRLLFASVQDHVYGNRNAEISIVEYAEIECPNCKLLHPVLQKIVDDSEGRVSLTFRHFPLIPHPKSFTEAHALECTAELEGEDLFWEYLVKIYDRSSSNNDTDLSILNEIAEDLGIPKDIFRECLESNRHHDRIQEDIGSGFALGVDSVPQLFIVSSTGQVVHFTRTPTIEMLRKTIETLQGAHSVK